jgi:hypothetical protein
VLGAAGAGCLSGSSAGQTGQPGWLLGVLVAAGVVGGWQWLYGVCAGYDQAPGRRRRILAHVFQFAAVGCAAGSTISWFRLRAEGCGRAADSAGTWEIWLFVAAVLFMMASVMVRRPGTSWLSAACVVIADLAVALQVLGSPAPSNVAVVLLLVHAACTAIATWWARQTRSCPPALAGKAGEASRVLAAAWVTLLILFAAAGHQIGKVLPDSAFAGLFVVTAVGLVFGPGYTRYLEVVHDPEWVAPEPDRNTLLAQHLSQAADRATRWAALRLGRRRRPQSDAARPTHSMKTHEGD